MKKSINLEELKTRIKAAFIVDNIIKEAKEEEEETETEETETEETPAEETPAEETPAGTEGGIEVDPKVSALQDALNVAYTAAKELNDQKLLDQIGNTITFFTRTHVVDAGSQGKKATEPVTEMRRFQKLAGIKK